MLVRQVRPRQPLAELEVADAIGAQQQRAERRIALRRVRDPDVAAGDRLDARAARRRVELDQAEQVGEVGQRQRRHGVVRGCAHRVVDANGAVGDRVLAVEP